MAVRVVLTIVGAIIVLFTWGSVIGTVIVPRPVSGRLTKAVDRSVLAVYGVLLARVSDYVRRDRWLSRQAAAILLGQVGIWLLSEFAGFTLLLLPYSGNSLTRAITETGSALFTLGFTEPLGTTPAVLVFAAAFSGLAIVTLQIAYLPTLYAAFNRRETEIALLNGRAGIPSWGPELLARTHYALGTGISTIDTLPDLFERWERWAADVSESHATYLPLVRFRSPRPLSSWVTALLAVLDSAALYLALSPESAPEVAARLCLRSGFTCFRRVGEAMGIHVPEEVTNGTPVSLTYDEFLDAVKRLREVDFPIEREPEAAWPHFAGWRVNYERAAYAIAAAVEAPPALWSGPRKPPMDPIPPLRPPAGRMGQPK
jgi:hypothetical protein